MVAVPVELLLFLFFGFFLFVFGEVVDGLADLCGGDLCDVVDLFKLVCAAAGMIGCRSHHLFALCLDIAEVAFFVVGEPDGFIEVGAEEIVVCAAAAAADFECGW